MPAARIAWNVVFAVVPAVLLLVLARPIVIGHARLVTSLLDWVGVAVTEHRVSFAGADLQVPGLAAPALPDRFIAAVLAVGGLIIGVVTLLPRARLTPARVLTGVVALICATSGFFFWVTPETFPYTPADFSAAWCRAEFVVWLVIPSLFAVLLSPLPLSPGETLLYTFQTMFYAMWFSAMRLTTLLIVFDMGGLVWMAPAFFLCGFLLDFVFIVAYYSLAVSRASRRLQSDRGVWRW